MIDRWPLTGRSEELCLIGEVLAGNYHRGVVVAGQAGVGKTRLASEAVAEAAADGWVVRRTAGTATGKAVALGAFARWADDVDASPSTLVRRILAALTSGPNDKRVLVFVDDAHLLDDLSALVVHQLTLHEMATVIATVRTGESAPDAITALWKNGMARRLELQPLSRNESGDLLRAALYGPVSTDCADRMWALCRGNVLFLHHLVEHEREAGRLAYVDHEWRRTGTPSASPSLVELVERQIGAVADQLRDVVDLVAIAEPVDRTLLTALHGQESVEAAEQRGLITVAATTDAVYVGHPLYGEIRLSQCGPLRRRRLRGRIAAAMEKAGTTDPLRLGLLWLESDLPADAGILSRAAGISASRLDLGLAERLARAAVTAQADPATQLLLAYILFLQEKGQESKKVLDALGPDEVGTAGFLHSAILRAANHLWLLRDSEGSRIVIDEALRLGDEDHHHSLRTFRAVRQTMAAEPAAALETMAAVDYDRTDDLGRILGYSAETLALGDLGRTDEAANRAAAGYRVLDGSPQDSFHSSGLAEFHAFALLAAGYVDDAVDIAEHWHRQYADLPGMSRSMAIAALGMTAIGRGDLVAARRYLSSASDSFGGYGETSGLLYRFRILHTEALARSGDIDAAIVSLESTRRSRHPAYSYVESAYLLASAWVAAAAGQVTEARTISSRATEFARCHGQLAREVLCRQAAVQFGDDSGAVRLADLGGHVDGPRAPLVARYARALAADDAAGLDAVSRDFEQMSDLLAAADAAAQAAVVHRLAGRRGSALTASARAHLLAKACGGAVSPALTAARVPLPFTPREHEIAKLVSHGRSNRDIAQATSLSIRTVEGYIYQASAKAGVSSRSELSELVRQFNELDAPTSLA